MHARPTGERTDRRWGSATVHRHQHLPCLNEVVTARVVLSNSTPSKQRTIGTYYSVDTDINNLYEKQVRKKEEENRGCGSQTRKQDKWETARGGGLQTRETGNGRCGHEFELLGLFWLAAGAGAGTGVPGLAGGRVAELTWTRLSFSPCTVQSRQLVPDRTGTHPPSDYKCTISSSAQVGVVVYTAYRTWSCQLFQSRYLRNGPVKLTSRYLSVSLPDIMGMRRCT